MTTAALPRPVVASPWTRLSASVSSACSAGPIGEKNRYAQIMLVLFPLAIFRFWQEKNRWLKLAAGVVMVCILSGVILTVSRGAFLGLVVVLALMG